MYRSASTASTVSSPAASPLAHRHRAFCVACLALCYFVFVGFFCVFFFFFLLFFFFFFFFFSPFSIAITSLGEERASLGAFCTFVRFALVWFNLFPLSLGVWEGLRFVIGALSGLFSYHFLGLCVLAVAVCI